MPYLSFFFLDQDNLHIIFNRIPKTASEAVVGISKNLSKLNNFTYIQSAEFDHFGGYSNQVLRTIQPISHPIVLLHATWTSK